MTTDPVSNADQTYYSQSVAEIENLRETLFDDPNSENPKIKEGIDSKKLQGIIERIESFMFADKRQFDYLNMLNTQLKRKSSNTSESTPIDHEKSSSSSSSLDFTDITYHEKISVDIKNLRKLSDSIANSKNPLTVRYSERLNGMIERIESVISLQFQSLKMRNLYHLPALKTK